MLFTLAVKKNEYINKCLIISIEYQIFAILYLLMKSINFYNATIFNNINYQPNRMEKI